MNLIPSNNLKEIILTEYELIKYQIRLKSYHYLDFYYKIELLSITVSLISHSKICIDWIFWDISRPGQFELQDAGLLIVFRQSLLNSSSIHPASACRQHINTPRGCLPEHHYAAPRKRLILGTHKQCNTEYWRRWMTNSKIPLNYL